MIFKWEVNKLAENKSMANIFVIVGEKKSGKDEIIRAVHELGGMHAQIVPKYTSRDKQSEDGSEIECNYSFEKGKEGYKIYKKESGEEVKCDIVYERNNNFYSIDTHQIWLGLRRNKFQVIVVSELEAINSLRRKFGGLVKLIYVHGKDDSGDSPEFQLFVKYFDYFDHVLIYESRKEDLYDQLFRLFRAYE